MTDTIDTARTYCTVELENVRQRSALAAEMTFQTAIAAANAAYASAGYVPAANAAAYSAAISDAHSVKAAAAVAVIAAISTARKAAHR